jgi:hypothetical protein
VLSLMDIAAVLLTLCAVFGWLNHKFLPLSRSVGLLVMSVLTSTLKLWFLGCRHADRAACSWMGPPHRLALPLSAALLNLHRGTCRRAAPAILVALAQSPALAAWIALLL